MKRLFSPMLLLICSLTLCGAAAHAQTWCVSAGPGGTKPKIAVDNDGVARILWLQENPDFDYAKDVYYSRFNPGPNNWSTSNWTNDSYNQHACDIEYDRHANCRWVAFDDSNQVHLAYYFYPDSVFYTLPVFDTLLPLDTNLYHPWISNQLVISQINFATDDAGSVIIAWSSDSITHDHGTGIYLKEIHDTIVGQTEAVMNGSAGFIEFFAHYVMGSSVIAGARPVFLERTEYESMLGYNYNFGFIHWVEDSSKWFGRLFAGQGYSMGGFTWGTPAVNLAIASDPVGAIFVFYATDPDSACDTVLCNKYDPIDGTLDTTYVLMYDTPIHSGAAVTMAHPTFAWSDSSNIYLQTYYDSLWSSPPKRINPVGVDSCINPDIDYDQDSIVWVSYESQGRIYVTRTSVPLGVTEKPTVQIPNPQSKISLKSWPNPAINVVHFAWALPSKRNSSVSIYDIAGRLVKTLDISNNQINWDCVDQTGRSVASGVYFARLRSNGQETIQRISIIK